MAAALLSPPYFNLPSHFVVLVTITRFYLSLSLLLGRPNTVLCDHQHDNIIIFLLDKARHYYRRPGVVVVGGAVVRVADGDAS